MGVMFIAVVGLSIVAFLAIMIGSASGADLETGIWPTVLVLPLFGLPFAFLLIIALILASIVRRRRMAGDAGR